MAEVPGFDGLSLRWKLLIAFTTLSVGLVFGTLVAIERSVGSAAGEKIQQDFRRTMDAMQQLVRTRLGAFSDSVDASLADSLFRTQVGKAQTSDADLGLGDDAPASATPAAGAALKETHDVFASADLPLFRAEGRNPVLAIVNAEGTLLFSKANRAAFGTDLRKLPMIARVLTASEPGGAVELWWSGDPGAREAGVFPAAGAEDLYLMMARTIVTAQGVVGAVLAGEAVSDSFLRELEQTAQSKVALVTDDGKLAFEPALKSWLEGVLAAGARDAISSPGVHRVTMGNERHLALSARIPGLREGTWIGRTYLFRSLEAELGPFRRRVRLAFGVAMAAALLVSFGVATLLSARMTGPIVALEAAARKVRGGDLSTHVDPKGRDEVGHLARTFNEMVEGLRQRDQIKATFKRYLAPAVVEQLIQHPEKLELGGETRELTILFSDLVGFTSLSEGRSAHDLVSLLNEYFDEVGKVIVGREGTLDKFAGDSVMCFFGAPLPQADHRARALAAALDHLRVIDELRTKWMAAGRPAIDCRIGLNTGEVVVGNIGSSGGQDYTVIGDAVNLASRLEGANKEYGTRLMASEFTLSGASDGLETRELDLLRVKGKREAVRVFEVLGATGEVADARLRLRDAFQQALAKFRAREFEAARAAFQGCLEQNPADGPSATFEKRSGLYLASPPAEDWDGVFEMKTK